MSTTDTDTAAFRMLTLTKSQTETAAKGLALFRQIAKEAQLGDWIDTVARFTQPLELAEALEQVHADLQALQQEIRARTKARQAEYKARRESLKDHFEAVRRYEEVLAERGAEAHRRVRSAEFARSDADELRNRRAHAAAIAEAEERADVEGARRELDAVLAAAQADHAAIREFRRCLDPQVLPQAVLALVPQPSEA